MRCRLGTLAVLIFLTAEVAKLGLGAHAAAGQPAATCPVTRPENSAPIPRAVFEPIFGGYRGPGALRLDGLHGNDALWVVLPSDDNVEGQSRSGGLDVKFMWVRLIEGNLTIQAQRIDGPAPPATASVPEGYGPKGFQASGVTFPVAGCWQVTGAVSGRELPFIVLVTASSAAWPSPPPDPAVTGSTTGIAELRPEPGWDVRGTVRLDADAGPALLLTADVAGSREQIARDLPRSGWPNLIWHLVEGDCASWRRASAVQTTPLPLRVLSRFVAEVETPGQQHLSTSVPRSWAARPLALAAFVNGGGPLVACADLAEAAVRLPSSGIGAMPAAEPDPARVLLAAFGTLAVLTGGAAVNRLLRSAPPPAGTV